MSDSTPEKTIKSSQTLSDQLTRMTPTDWALSVVLHVIVIGLILWIAPKFDSDHSLVGNANSTSTNSQNTPISRMLQDPDRIRDLSSQIEKNQTERAAQKVSELTEIESKLEKMSSARLEAYDKMARAAALEKLKDVSENQKKMIEDQTSLKNKIHDFQESIDRLLQQNSSPSEIQANTQNMLLESEKLQQLISENQRKALESQNEASKLIETNSNDVFSPQKIANESQESALNQQKNENAAQKNSLEMIKKWVADSQEYSKADQKKQALQNELNQLNGSVIPQKKQAVDDSANKVVSLEKAFQEAINLANQTNLQQDKDASLAAQKNLEETKARLSEVQKDFSNIQKNAEEKSRQLKEAENLSSDLQSRLKNNSLQNIQKQFSQEESSQQAAISKQVEAQKKQTEAISQLNSWHSSSSFSSTHTEASILSSHKGKSLAELYEEAKSMEQRIAESYKMLRAIELAFIRKISLKEALQAIQITKFEHEPLDLSLLNGNEAFKNLDLFKTQALKVDQQIGAMITSGEQMLSMAEDQKGLSQGDVQIGEWLKNQKQQAEFIEKQSRGDKNLIGKDMTSIMNGEGGGNGHGDSSSKSTSTGAQGVPSYAQAAPELPSLNYLKTKSFSARKFSFNGTQSSEWFHIDSWYLIGPFPNRNRENLYTKFPPEMIIDLNAVYPGKDGKAVAWHFIQWGQPRMQIPHDKEDAPSVYYAYTEIDFDEACDLWICMGSDDKGTVWINNTLVWESWDEFKAWKANEAYRKVHFSKGRNKILYRIENGQFVAMMSLMISSKR